MTSTHRSLTRPPPYADDSSVADDTSPQLDDEIQLTTDLQLRAISNVVRHRILRLLLNGPATIGQLSASLDLLKGSTSYHLRLLEEAGLVYVASVRKVRGVHERTYARVAKKIVVPDPGGGQPDIVMRHALADLEAAPADAQRMVDLRHVRIDTDTFDEFAERLGALARELSSRSTPDAPAADLAIALFRPAERPPADRPAKKTRKKAAPRVPRRDTD
jgi:DNA-binding transcriptional ArsR family regulator